MIKTAEEYKSTCCYCGVGCGVVVTKHPNGQLSLRGDESHPSSKGMLCSKGMNLHYTVMDQSDRLLHPQMRYNRSMPLQQVSWDTALDRTAAIFKTFIQNTAPILLDFMSLVSVLPKNITLSISSSKASLGQIILIPTPAFA